MDRLFVADGHLDLAYNALRGRNLLVPANEQPANSDGPPTVSFPDLRKGSVGLVGATVFALPKSRWTSLTGEMYETNEQAFVIGQSHVRFYRDLEMQGEVRIVTRRDELPTEAGLKAIPIILLMENGDQIRDVSDVKVWFDAGVRVVGLAWRGTKYCGGTGVPGPLTEEGIDVVKALDAIGMIHDISHLSEESFWQLMDLTRGPVLASHSNCRAYVPADRQISDAMIRAIVDRGGVIGMNFYDGFLMLRGDYRKRRCDFGDLIRHIDRVCEIAGNANHVGIGTDMDGGVAQNEIPQQISTSADLPKLADALLSRGYSEPQVRDIMGVNWLRYFRENLPK